MLELKTPAEVTGPWPSPVVTQLESEASGIGRSWRKLIFFLFHFSTAPWVFFLLFINCQHFIFYFSALALVCVSRSFSICFSIILFCARRCVRLIYIYILFCFLIIFIRWNRAGLLSPALFAARSVVVLDSSVHFVITPLKFRLHSSA